MFRITEVDGGEINLVNTSGTQVNPATEDTLDAIKDTDGIKKIVDALPAGSNLLGKVQIRNPGDTVDLGDDTNPVRIDPTGTTTQPISASALPLPTGAATEATLSTADGRLATIDTVLDAIKDTDGIKKIVDALPVGANVIGKVHITNGSVDADVGTTATGNNRVSVASRITDGVDWITSVVNDAIRRLEVRSSITSPDGVTDADVGTTATANNRLSVASRLTDGTGWLSSILNNSIRRLEGRNSITAPDGILDVAVVTDNSINRLESRASIVGQTAGTGSEKKVSVINDTVDSNVKRLQTQALLAPGSIVNIGTSIPADPANLLISFLKDTGGSENMRVNGSVTPVEFLYQPASGITISVDSVLLVFTTDDMYFDGLSFGPNLALTTGIKLELTISSVATEIFNIMRNEDFLRVPGRVPVINNTGPKDLVAIAFSFGGLIRLVGSNSDHISMVVRDNLTSVKFKHLSATIYGAEV